MLFHSRPVRALVSLVLGFTLVVVVAQGFMSERLSPLASVLLAPVVMFVDLVPLHKIGPPDRPVYEGTPMHLAAALAGYVVTGAIYALVAYRVLTAYNRRRPRTAPEL
jgi:hypothetical protein